MRDEPPEFVTLELEDVVFVELKEVLEVVGRGFTVGIGGFLGGVLEFIFEGFSPVLRFGSRRVGGAERAMAGTALVL
ncbi:MAG TPA: hypothetical protein DCZ55_13740 [Cyanobacteria bacterium UBA11371]|nr:hypothetical protein [Cyanobacteria bacterium UBA11371]HBE37072.1 hypothetical protein [Cyanobacteria bacterium UBA11368]